MPANFSIGESRAFPGTTWDETEFGGCPYYYNMNYDGVAQAMATFYAIFIQGGWEAISDGAIQVTTAYARLFFASFYIIMALIMCEILTGVIIDSMYAVREEMLKNSKGQMDELETIIMGRISSTRGPSGNFYSDTWELLDIPLYTPLRFDASMCELFSEENADAAKHHMLQSDIAELQEERALVAFDYSNPASIQAYSLLRGINPNP